MRWEKKLTKEQSEQIQNQTEELMEEAMATGADCGVAVDAGWDAIKRGDGKNLDVRFQATFFGLTEEDVRHVITAASCTVGLTALALAKEEKAAKAGK